MHSIVTEGLGRRFDERWAVRDLNLQINEGEVFALLGPNGAGKTTTMRLLASLISPTVGRAVIYGLDSRTHANRIRERVGILTESPGLYENLSAEQNLRYFARLYDIDSATAGRRIERYLRLFDLWERRHDRTGTFSKGMKQKLSMARALLHEPSVLILDEPTSVLDPESARVVRDFMITMREAGRTIILCTHNLFEAQSLADRVAIVKGTVLRVGTPKQLQRSLYGQQMEFRIANAAPEFLAGTGEQGAGLCTINDFAEKVALVDGVQDVVANGDRLLVSMMEPEDLTPQLVRLLVDLGADLLKVAEVEHSLESAYLDLIARETELEIEKAVERVEVKA